MKKYIGTKTLFGKPMNRADYCAYRGWTLPADENGADEGYLVEYTDGGEPNHKDHKGYISWSPKEVFEKSYSECTGLTIGGAIYAIKNGQKIARSGWNGKGMFVQWEPAWPGFNPFMSIKNVDGSFSTWVPSGNDCLAEDWQIVE